jgi:hypothetical protein
MTPLPISELNFWTVAALVQNIGIRCFSSPDANSFLRMELTMPEAVMTKRKRDIRDAMLANERVREMGHTVAQFREIASDDQKEIVADLTSMADSLIYELRDRILDLVRKNLGPQQQANLMLVLRKADEWLNEERAGLQSKTFLGLRVSPSPKDAQRLRELDAFETFLQGLAKDILRAMADFNFQKSRAQ